MAKAKKPTPQTPEEWLDEIARAYVDAKELVPFGALVGQEIMEKDLFHLAPAVCLKFRGLPQSKKILKKATEAALASYAANEETMAEALSKPKLAFGLCYVASHLALGFLTEGEASRVLEFVENQGERLEQLIEAGSSPQDPP